MRKPLRLPFDPVARAERLWRRRWGAGDSMGAATSVMRVQQLLLARYDEALRPYGLTFARYEALVLLHFSRSERLPLSVIGERLMVHPTSVTNIVQRLEQAGLVDRVPNPRDGRGSLAGITSSGLELMQRATDDLVALDFGLEALDPADRRELFRLLRKVRLRAGDFEPDAADESGPEPRLEPEPRPESRPEPDPSATAPGADSLQQMLDHASRSGLHLLSDLGDLRNLSDLGNLSDTEPTSVDR